MAARSLFISVSLVVIFLQCSLSFTPYPIDYTNGVGRRFDGIGAISGGGATSKLLVNYPEPQRSQILDYLFKPNFGASLQILKVEIGGDAQSSEGTELSHMHNAWDENYSRGYEWWLMVEAKKTRGRVEVLKDKNKPLGPNQLKQDIGVEDALSDKVVLVTLWHCAALHDISEGLKVLVMDSRIVWNEYEKVRAVYVDYSDNIIRNPDIKLYGLPWGFPGWLSDGAWWPYRYPNRTANYIVKWIKGASAHYNLTIDYIGIWNEKPYDPVYIKTLKHQLVKQGLGHVKIVAADAINSNGWDIAKDMAQDPELMKAVDIIGAHYSGTYSTPEAKSIGKPLWSSEDYSNTADDYGAACMARLLNQNYVNGLMSGFIAWNLITSYYDNLPYKRHSLMIAQQPWSGHYDVSGPIWTTAHTTQFSSIGWTYLANGTGSGFLKKGGSYVSLVSPNKKDLTIVIETTNGLNEGICLNIPMHPYPVKPQNVTFNLKGPLANIRELNVWKSKIDFKKGKSYYFQQGGSLKVVGGSVSLYLGVDEVITLTTVVHGVKGSYGLPPKPAPFPVTYNDNFEKCREQNEANNFAQQVGAFEVHQTNTAQHGKVLRQVMLQTPIHWCPFVQTSPLNVIGDFMWKDVVVSADIRTPKVNGSSGTFLAAHVNQGGCTTMLAKGVFMFIDSSTEVVELALDLARSISIKKVNFVLDPDTWYKATLEVKGNMTIGTIDGQVVFKENVQHTSPHGFIALGSVDFGLAEYDNFQIRAS